MAVDGEEDPQWLCIGNALCPELYLNAFSTAAVHLLNVTDLSFSVHAEKAGASLGLPGKDFLMPGSKNFYGREKFDNFLSLSEVTVSSAGWRLTRFEKKGNLPAIQFLLGNGQPR
jgi:hypothetical protein